MFTSEAELAAPVAKWLQTSGGSCIAEEVEVGYGIPDMVAGVGAPQQLKNRRRQADPITDPVQLALLEFCRVTRSEQELRDWAPGTFSELTRRAVQPLLKTSMLTVTVTGYRARRHPRDPFDRLVAVELKLRPSERGFAQANSYRLFAEDAFLAVPAGRVTPTALNRARVLGVGLLAVHPDSCDELVEPAPRSLATPGRRRLASEQVLAASRRLDGRRAGSPAGNMLVS